MPQSLARWRLGDRGARADRQGNRGQFYQNRPAKAEEISTEKEGTARVGRKTVPGTVLVGPRESHGGAERFATENRTGYGFASRFRFR
jgi:hypothetical protein